MKSSGSVKANALNHLKFKIFLSEIPNRRWAPQEKAAGVPAAFNLEMGGRDDWI
jgi:hypothetical protein